MAMSCDVGHRHGSDPALLWLWHRPAAAALIQPLVWELPFVTGRGLKRAEKGRKKKSYKGPLNNTEKVANIL